MVMKLMKWNWFIKFEKINAVIKLVWFDGMREFKLNEWIKKTKILLSINQAMQPQFNSDFLISLMKFDSFPLMNPNWINSEIRNWMGC